MDQRSVEAALQGEPTLAGRFEWVDPATVSFMPDQPFLPETQVALTFQETARASNGLTMLAPVSIAYQTTGFLELAQGLPTADSQEVDAAASVVAAFNRPVVPLGGDPQSAPPAFTLEPAAAGQGTWLNTSTYVFTPAPGLAGGVTYTVRLNPALRSTRGGPLVGKTQWTFSTAFPRLISHLPENGAARVRIDQPVTLTFNQPMNPDSVAAHFALTSASGQEVAGTLTWEDQGKTLRFTAAQLLTRGQTLRYNRRGPNGGACGKGPRADGCS